MDGEVERSAQSFIYNPVTPDFPPDLCAPFMAHEFRDLQDAADRRARVANLVAGEIVPRLAVLHKAAQQSDHPTPANIDELARLVLGPEGEAAANYIVGLKAGGLSTEVIFAELLEPAARHLGRLWDQDEADFMDVTLGVGRLQALLSLCNETYAYAASSPRRTVLMLTVPSEQHSFGAAMVERFLESGGWLITSQREAPLRFLSESVKYQYFAVAGITMSNRGNLDKVAAAIAAIRKSSCNPNIGVMVGGPAFSADPGLAAMVGADGTASTAASAVLLAQKLLDRAIAA